MENDPFIDDVPIRTSIYKGCSMVDLLFLEIGDKLRWLIYWSKFCFLRRSTWIVDAMNFTGDQPRNSQELDVILALLQYHSIEALGVLSE